MIWWSLRMAGDAQRPHAAHRLQVFHACSAGRQRNLTIHVCNSLHLSQSTLYCSNKATATLHHIAAPRCQQCPLTACPSTSPSDPHKWGEGRHLLAVC